MLRKLLLFCLFGLTAAASPVSADDLTSLLGASNFVAAGGVLNPPGVLPQMSALFGTDNDNVFGHVNYALEANNGTQGAFYLPGATTINRNSWYVVMSGVTSAAPDAQATSNSYLMTGRGGLTATTFGCASNTCTGGNDHQLLYALPGSGVVPTFHVAAERGGAATAQYWTGGSVKTAAITAGSGMNNGVWAWTLTGSTCSTPPSGQLLVGASTTSGTIQQATVTNPGQNCPTSGTATVTMGMTASGICTGSSTGTCGASSNAVATLSWSFGTGIVTSAGRRWCGVIGQYGDDYASGAYTGEQFAAFVDQNGNWLSGSPSISTTVNNTASPASANWYYAASSSTLATRNYSGVGDLFNLLGSSVTTTGANEYGYGGALANVGMVYGIFPSTSGSPNQAALQSLCNSSGTSDPLVYLRSLSSTTINSFYRLNDPPSATSAPGWGDHSGAEIVGTVTGATLTVVSVANGAVTNGQYLSGPALTGTGGPYTISGCAGSPPTETCAISGSPGNVTGASLALGTFAPAIPIVAGQPVAAAPVGVGPALVLNDPGPYEVFPVTNYAAATGAMNLSGSYSASALGGTPSGVQAQISTSPSACVAISGYGPGCGWTTLSGGSISAGAWSGNLTGVPAGGPYYLTIRPSNGTSYTVESGAVQVGLNIVWAGQSQQNFCWSSNATGATMAVPTGYVDVATGLMNLGAGGSTNAWAAPYSTFGAEGRKLVTNATYQTNSAGYGLGDCMVAFLSTLNTLTGWPVEANNFTKPGSPVDAWIDGYTKQGLVSGSPVSLALSSSGACAGQGSYCYTATVAFQEGSFCPSLSSSTCGTLAYNAATLGNAYSGLPSFILAGTLKGFVSGAQICADAATPTLNVSSGACSGGTVSYSAINYMTNAVTIAFSSAPAAAPTVQWTNIVDISIAAGNGTTPSAFYDANDFTGNGAASSGSMSTILSSLSAHPSAWLLDQGVTNSSEFSPTWSTGAASMTAKWSYAIGKLFPSIFPQVLTSTPVVALAMPRYSQVAAGTSTVTQYNGLEQWNQTLGTGANGYQFNGPNPIYYGGSYPDDLTGASGVPSSGPHETVGVYGGQRIGRRAAIEGVWWPLVKGHSTLMEPSLATTTVASTPCSINASPCFDNGLTYNAACAATAYSCIDFVFALNNSYATALATCGTSNLSGGVAAGVLPTGACSIGSSTGQVVRGFRIGSAQAMNTATGSVYDDGLDPNTSGSNGTFTQSSAFSCTIVANTSPAFVVQCVKSSGAWTSGATYTDYLDTLGWGRPTQLFGNPGGTGFSVAAGSGYTASASATLTGTGGGCSPEPTLKVSTNVAGQISSAYPASPGGGCTSAPSFTISGLGAGSGGAVGSVAANIGTSSTDMNLIGQFLYDNAATSATLSPAMYGSGGSSYAVPCPAEQFIGSGTTPSYCEPGMPVTPFGLVTGVAVSG